MTREHEPTLLTDRRLDPRTSVRCRLDVTHPDGRFLGCMVDLSLGGMRLRCAAGTDIGSVERLRIEFQRWLGLGERLALSGRFVWRKPADMNGWFDAGFALGDLSKAELTTLEALVTRLEQAAHEDGRRAPGV